MCIKVALACISVSVSSALYIFKFVANFLFSSQDLLSTCSGGFRVGERSRYTPPKPATDCSSETMSERLEKAVTVDDWE